MAKLTAKQAAAKLKEINDAKKAANEEAKELRAQLNEGKEARKAQRQTRAAAKKLFRDRRSNILKAMPAAVKALGEEDPIALEAQIGVLEQAFDDMGEILRAQKAMLEDESVTPDLSTFELSEAEEKDAKDAKPKDAKPKAKATSKKKPK